MPFHEIQTTTPKIGDVVTFAYEKNSRRDIPVRPKIIRIRTDISWEDILRNTLTEGNNITKGIRLACVCIKLKFLFSTS